MLNRYAALAAVCLTAPVWAAPVATTTHATPQSTITVDLTADSTSFDAVPPSARLLQAPATGTSEADLLAAADTAAALAGVDTGTLLLELLTVPWHNIYAVSIAAGKAANAAFQLVSLPFSIATYVLTNRTSEIPTYIQTVQKNLAAAVPGVFSTIKSELQYDADLFSQLFGGSGTGTTQVSTADVSKTTAAADATDTGTLFLQLLTAPYHNIYAVSIAAGKAANAALQLVSLPFSIATYILTNRTDEIPTYISTVKTNLSTAVPGIFSSIKSEIAYDKNLFQQVFGGSSTLTVASKQAPNLLGGAQNASVLADATAPPSDQNQPAMSKTGGLHHVQLDTIEESDAQPSDESAAPATDSKTEAAEDAAETAVSDKGEQTSEPDAQQPAEKPAPATEPDKTPTGATAPSGTTSGEQRSGATGDQGRSDRGAKAGAAQGTTGGKHRRHDRSSDAA